MQDFFGLDVNINIFNDIILPLESFDYLLYVAPIFNYSDEILKIIIDRLPLDNHFDSNDKILIQKLIDNKYNYKGYVIICDDILKLLNNECSILHKSRISYNNDINYVYLSHNNKYAIFVLIDNTIFIYNTLSLKLEHTIYTSNRILILFVCHMIILNYYLFITIIYKYMIFNYQNCFRLQAYK